MLSSLGDNYVKQRERRERAICTYQSDQKEPASTGRWEVSRYRSSILSQFFQKSVKKVDFKVSLDELRD